MPCENEESTAFLFPKVHHIRAFIRLPNIRYYQVPSFQTVNRIKNITVLTLVRWNSIRTFDHLGNIAANEGAKHQPDIQDITIPPHVQAKSDALVNSDASPHEICANPFQKLCDLFKFKKSILHNRERINRPFWQSGHLKAIQGNDGRTYVM